jgi:hypothetical protein
MRDNSVMPSFPAMHRSQVGVGYVLDSEHGSLLQPQLNTAVPTGASVWRPRRWSRSLRRVRDHGRQHLCPQMPWYMAHYCDSQFTGGDGLDPVCYGDYLSTFNDGFNLLPGKDFDAWPNSVPWSVFPTADPVRNHCKPKEITCTLVMGAFDLSPVKNVLSELQYYKYQLPDPPDGGPNNLLFRWFNGALAKFPSDFKSADFYHHFPWSGTPVTWGADPNSPADLYNQAVNNPFLGQFTFTNNMTGGSANCQISLTGANPSGCTTLMARADHYLYPRQCTVADLAGTDITRLRACGLDYELHHNGWWEEWPPAYQPFLNAKGMTANQYGRTSFLFAGVPGEQLPVSFYKNPNIAGGLSVYEQVYNASIFSLYMPIANEADFKNALASRNYTRTQFYHTLLMTNHMESDPDEFAEGIRGRTLWHDEYRTEKMYEDITTFPNRRFAASFDPQKSRAPFHNNTCDGCHVRNGSGIPINPAYKLDATLQPPQGFMTSAEYNPYSDGESTMPKKDYTFTGQIWPMKLVFFDLKRVTSSNDDSVYSKPLTLSSNPVGPGPSPFYYNNKIMNFYGDSFHVKKLDNPNYPVYNFDWSYGPAN